MSSSLEAVFRNVKDMFGDSMNYLYPFFINFYRGIGLLTKEENLKFLLEIKIVGLEYEEVLEGNEVVSDDDDVEPTLPLAKDDMSDEDIEERPMKRQRKLQTPSASEVVGRHTGLRTWRSAPVRMRSTSTYARDKVKA
ncbi:hypothetical protein AXG93_4510s1210 [Marchantia polymorpha subsp. ruderalis]|uniref:Uncharacterized protein n=1 Tax=Marchantia polymorpha subsp. ruderalis TaxID=1480154 RepID=A0A176WGC2_MARPO|nr:hypothetical protein AXG93_4510s1210 [Marchantia polymorpha subsp. ruderalis]